MIPEIEQVIEGLSRKLMTDKSVDSLQAVTTASQPQLVAVISNKLTYIT